jgi:hypothetical protein
VCLRSLAIEVEVTLQMTVSQSACLGVEPTLGLVTRYYRHVTIYFASEFSVPG